MAIIDSSSFILVPSVQASPDTETLSPNAAEDKITYKVADEEAPQYDVSSIGYDSTIIGQPCELSCNWSDNVGLSSWRLEHNNTGSYQNEIGAFSGTTWSKKTLSELNYNIGATIRFRFHASDTSNNWNSTPWQTFQTTVYDIEDEIQFIFSKNVGRRVNSSFPYVMDFKEDTRTTDTSRARPQPMLMGVSFYKYTGNQTYLDYAYDVADWMNSTKNAFDVWSIWDERNNQWLDIAYKAKHHASETLLLLCQLAQINSSYTYLLERSADTFIDYFIDTDNYYRVYNSVKRDGAVGSSDCMTEHQGWSASALAWAYNITGNDTYRDIAVRMCMNYTLGKAHLPPHIILHSGTVKSGYNYAKEDQTYGYWLLSLENVYYWTRNGTVKDLINETAWYGAKYFWHLSYKRFVYRVNPDTGAHLWTIAVHGFGLIDEALWKAHLLFGNTTWRDRARQDWDSLVITQGANNQILERNLITHSTSTGQHDSALGWNVRSIRFGQLMFNYLNNVTYLTHYHKLYAAHSYCHKKMGGYAVAIYADNINTYYDPTDDYRPSIFHLFHNETATISSFDDVFEKFGEPLTGAYVYFEDVEHSLNVRIKDWDLTDNIQGAKVYKDSDVKTSDRQGWANWTQVSGTVQIKVEYLGYWVNGTFTTTMDGDKTIDVRCRLYDATFRVKDYSGTIDTADANVTVYNSTSLTHQIKSGVTNSTGQVRLTNLPNNTFSLAVYPSGTNYTVANVTREIISDECSPANLNTNPFFVSFSHPAIKSIYEVKLDVNATFNIGTNLTIKFYSYSGTYRGETTVWNGTTPTHIELSIQILHPLNLPVEIATLVLTDKGRNEIYILNTFIMCRSHLMERICELDVNWLYAPSTKQSILFSEIAEIGNQWAYAP